MQKRVAWVVLLVVVLPLDETIGQISRLAFEVTSIKPNRSRRVSSMLWPADQAWNS